MIKNSLCLLLALCFFYSASCQLQPVLTFDQKSVRITGWSSVHPANRNTEPSSEVVKIYTHEAWVKRFDQAVSGTLSKEDSVIIFTPDFPFSAGQTYVAVFDPRALPHGAPHSTDPDAGKHTMAFTIPQLNAMPTTVQTIYPESSRLPENLLRVHVVFSNSMMPGAYDHIRLLREDGSEVERPFLLLDQELWDAERKRFTLLFDPGRIKRTLAANLELGTPLEAGMNYKLVIDSTWRDINGNPLSGGYAKEFTVTPAQRTQLKRSTLHISTPTPGGSDSLRITFDRPMDRVLMMKYISVSDATGTIIPGAVHMSSDSVWTFHPNQLWTKGKYLVSFLPIIEDVCGNNFINVFDLDLKKQRRINSDKPVVIEVALGQAD